MSVDFSNSKFATTYSFSSPRGIIRVLSDAFSKQFCETTEAVKYAAQATNGRCLFCGKKMYSLEKGAPTFSNTIHYDHIYPASKFGLFEVGNIAIACESCNLAKSDRLPLEYYDMRTAEEAPLLYYNKDEFEEFLDNMTEPYRNKWPEYFEASNTDYDDEDFKIKLTELMYDPVDISPANMRYSHESSVNWSTWEKVIARAYQTYKASTAKDVEHRIGFANERFEITFGSNKLMSQISLLELKEFFDEILVLKYDSKNEISKYRMLIKMLIEVLNEDLLHGQLDNLYSEVPTYSKIVV